MAGRHTAPGAPTLARVPIPRRLLGRAGMAAALATAAGAAVAGSTGALAAVGTDSAATTGTQAIQAPTVPAAQTAMLAAPAATPAPRAAAAPVAMPGVARPAVARPAVIRHAPTSTPTPRATHTTSGGSNTARGSVEQAVSKHAVSKHAVSTQAAAPAAAGSVGSRIVAEAAKHKGTPYVWGATGPSSFDCSGFTGYTFKKMGISLPRTAQAQYDAAQHLSRSQAQPGDLIFQGGPNSVYHVAIYAGNGKIWTAPEPGESVKLGNLWGDWHVGRIR